MSNEKLLRVLSIFDSSEEAEALINILRNAGYIIRDIRVEDDEDMETAIEENPLDIILAKQSLPIFDAEKAVKLIIASGSRLIPARVGVLAAAGHSHVPVVRQLRVGIIATGDEVVAPGEALPEGKLYASNLMTLHAWCDHYGMHTGIDIVRDDPGQISSKLRNAASTHDAILTSGGAWKGDRDFVVRVLEQLDWEKVYHRVKIGPGKAVGFGLLKGKPVFILPGGPPSNLMAFLQLALPGLLKLAGHKDPQLPRISVTLMESVTGQIDWTQFIFGCFKERDGNTYFHSLKKVSRLRSMAEAEGIISIPEGVDYIPAGAEVPAQVFMT